jgi:uracil-DNA glycosylase family 4
LGVKLMTDKELKYREMVALRKACTACPGLINPSQYAGGQYDSEEIGVWSRWQGGLDALVMVVAQDWGDVNSFEKQRGIDNDSRTNKKLRERLAEARIHIDLPSGQTSRGEVFFTNAVLCLKPGGVQDPLRREWVANCSRLFLRPQIELIQPKLVICLGHWAHRAVFGVYGLQVGKFGAAVKLKQAIRLSGGTSVLVVYHCGPRLNRPLVSQDQDWMRITAFIQQIRNEGFAQPCGAPDQLIS